MAPYRGKRGPGSHRGGTVAHGDCKDGAARNGNDSTKKYERHPQIDSHAEQLELEEEDDVYASSEEELSRPQRRQHSYSSLLQSFQSESSNRPRKRRRIEPNDNEASDAGSEATGVDPKPANESRECFHEEQAQFHEDESDSDEGGTSDPFDVHFVRTDDELLRESVKALTEQKYVHNEESADKVLKSSIATPKVAQSRQDLLRRKRVLGVRDMSLKKRLVAPATRVMAETGQDELVVAQSLFNYNDLLFGNRTVANAGNLRNLVTLHALNHLFKTRDKILKNNTRLARNSGSNDLDCRDQGFTRPKVLFILETRSSCAKYIDSIVKLCEPEQQENRKRFQDAFVQGDKYPENKPADFLELFEGNDDNDFRLGLKFTRKTLKFYAQFYSSDIIFASPLGLRRAINADDPKNTDYDFLSSIELVVLDQTDAMLMQNWEHVEHALDHLNLVPKQSHDCDYSRVRKWYLDHEAKYLRQTIVLSAYITPELNRLYSTAMLNYAGKVKITRAYDGAIAQIGQPVRQTFNRYDSQSPVSDPDDRFKYFTSTIVPALARQTSADEALGTLVFIPSYLDFVRLRNFFTASTDTQNISFGSISEYTDMTEVRRARSHLTSGRHSVLLYTGRAHHFRRYQIRGVKKVIMYSLPDNPVFYTELVDGFLGSSLAAGKVDVADASARVLFSKWDSLALERIVGTKRVAKMLKSGLGDTFDFR